MGQILSKVAQIKHKYSDNSQQTSVVTDHLPSPAIFPQYQGLPPELKLMVWEHAFEPRRIRIWGQWIPNYASRSNDAPTSRYVIKSSECNPAALSVDRETRAMAFRCYRPIQFRCRLTLGDRLALEKASDESPRSLWCYLRNVSDISLVAESLAYFSRRLGDTVDMDLVNRHAYYAYLLPNSRALDFSSSDHFQILRMKGCRHDFDHVVTSVLWPTAYFHWHILGNLTTGPPESAQIEAILRLRCDQERHGSGDFKIISESGAIRCRLCGKRLAWGIQL